MASALLDVAAVPQDPDCAAVQTDLFVLHRHETVIGRDDTCHLAIRDGTVSRRHARFVLKDDGVYVEDLASQHGTFLNGRRLYGIWPVHPGELVAFARFEIWIGRAHHGRTLLLPSTRSDGDALIPWSESRPRCRTNPQSETWRHEPTDRRLSTGGDRLGAKMRMLEEHLAHLNASLRDGQTVPATILDRAGHYAVRFARMTKEHCWIDRVVELHLLARVPLCDHMMQQLLSLGRAGVSCTGPLLSRYLEEMTPEECSRVTSVIRP
jgi:pSer/pThr/pTyr-binding forkhead associated (FHA) protein